MNELQASALHPLVNEALVQYEAELRALRESVAWNTEQRAIQHREICRLQALIAAHNDACRECPVIELPHSAALRPPEADPLPQG